MSSAGTPPAHMAPTEPPPGAGRTAAWLARLEWVLLIGVPAGVVLTYPLFAQGPFLRAMRRLFELFPGAPGRWVQDQFEPLLQFLFSPLLLKGAVAALLMVLFVVVRAVRHLLAPAIGEPRMSEPGPGRFAFAGVAAFVVFATLSAAWSPTPMLAAESALWMGIYGVFAWVLLHRGLSSSEARVIATLLIALGVATTLLIYGQALPPLQQYTFKLFYEFDDPRNQFGSLLGHNTAAASFLLLTSFPALAAALSARRMWIRVAACVYLCAVVPAILIVQSRAIWLLGPPLWVIAAATMLRRTRLRGARWVPTIMLAALVLAIGTQMVDAPWNPLYVRDSPLARRLKALTPEALMGEARLRLNIIGVTLIPERPLFGHGLYAFQYVYPLRQGEYFSTHPDSRLNQPALRSNLAHNDYLQVLIEQGLIGGALLAWGLGQAVLRGWRRRRRIGGRDRMLHEAFGWSALGLALHGFVDFPFHVPQLAIPGLLCLAAWAGWRRGPLAGAEPIRFDRAALIAADHNALRPWAALRLAGAMACVLLFFVVSAPLARILQADVYYRRGNNILETFRAIQSDISAANRSRLLNTAIEDLQRSVRLHPPRGMAWVALGKAYWVVGQRFGHQALRAQALGDRLAWEEHYELAIKAYENAAKCFNEANHLVAFAAVDYLQARVFRDRYRIDPSPEVSRQYIASLRRALALTPAMAEAAYELAEHLAAQPGADAERILHLRRLFHRHQAGRFEEVYIHAADRLVAAQQYEAARARAQAAVDVLSDRADARFLLGEALMRLGRSVEAMPHLAAALEDPDLDPFRRVLAEVFLAGATRDWARALEWLNRASFGDLHEKIREEQDLRLYAEKRAMQLWALEHVPGGEDPGNLPPPPVLSTEAWQLRLVGVRAALLRWWVGDPPASAVAIDERLALGGEPTVSFWIEAFRTFHQLGTVDRMERCLNEIRRLEPEHPLVPLFQRYLANRGD